MNFIPIVRRSTLGCRKVKGLVDEADLSARSQVKIPCQYHNFRKDRDVILIAG
jgi:hypothetical protein